MLPSFGLGNARCRKFQEFIRRIRAGDEEAAVHLVRKLGGNVVGCAFIVELDSLKGRERLAPINCFSLIHYD